MSKIKCFMLTPVGEDPETGFTNYRREDMGEVYRWLNPAPRESPVGGMYWCDWLDAWGFKRKLRISPDGAPKRYFPDEVGRCLAVITPGGTWIIDSRASNCTRPTDDNHRCWCRHGEAPAIHVDKVGDTCNAGAGSIQAGNWHGYLTNGYLQEER